MQNFISIEFIMLILKSVGGERTVKKLRLSKALTIPEGTTVSEACRRMAARRVDAVLLIDGSGLLSGIVTDKDIATRVIAEELRPDQTVVSKIMTRNPIFVTSDSLAIEALQKMVQGKFRHLPVVENGEVVALLDITKCLYDAISRMEKAAEQGSAIAAAVEGVERQFGSAFSAPSAFIETLRDRMFKPALSTIISDNTNVATVSMSDPVYAAAKKMREFRVNSVIILAGSKIQGILTSRDILMRVVAKNLSPELTLVEKVMTPNPECASLDSTILEALHIMHDGKFLHLPVTDRDGNLAACVDVLQITQAAISMVENSSGAVNDVANTVMQKFWDSALNLDPPDDSETQSEMSMTYNAHDVTEPTRSTYPSLGLGSSFSFKFEDCRRRVHRFNFGTENLGELISAVMQRISLMEDQQRPQLLYEDDEGDKVLLTTDGDLIAAVSHARSIGKKVLKLHLDYEDSSEKEQTKAPVETATVGKEGWLSARSGVCAGAVVLANTSVSVSVPERLRDFLSWQWLSMQDTIPFPSQSRNLPLFFSKLNADPSSNTKKEVPEKGNDDSMHSCNCLRRDSIANAAAIVGPAVVNIRVPFAYQGLLIGRSDASGTIIDADGTILTCAHVVIQSLHSASKGRVDVTLQDGRTFEGTVVNADLHSDIAIVKIKSKAPLPVAKLGTSRKLRPGDWVLAVGCPLSLQNTVTAGIVSCVDRKSSDLGLGGMQREYLQTDCAINGGNSGGPLVNVDGEVVGVNFLKVANADGLSFAVPIDSVSKIIEHFKRNGRVVRPWLGLKMLDLNELIVAQIKEKDTSFPNINQGVLISMVTPGSPADLAGFHPGDIVVEFDGKPVRSIKEIIDMLGDKVGKPFRVVVKRASNAMMTLTVIPAEANQDM
ncbi:kinase modulator [Lithospermum erythrorhizon]|uniref:Kinase modulator n=1 Tax=Lithospermum erythrorhizon TaxID=34254 RepID=A0AAV3PA34_LITER